jgi:N-acetylmuramoyl-L-alanine amidase
MTIGQLASAPAGHTITATTSVGWIDKGGAVRRVASCLIVAAMAAVNVLALVTPPVAAGNGPITSVTVKGSPFYPNGDGVRETVRLKLTLTRRVHLAIDVIDFDGNEVTSLLASTPSNAGSYKFKWHGRDAGGQVVDDGPYWFRVTATRRGHRWTETALFTKAPKVIYPANPAAIVVAVDPGHGDVYSEAGRVAPDGTREAVINLDIGLRLQAMLEGAGVRTTISRTQDQGANTPEWDRTGDGVIDYADELEARCDIANAGRADVFIAIHNNFSNNTNVGGPATYYWPDRPYSEASYTLAELVQHDMLARLDLYRTDSWYPSRSHGVLTHGYYVLHEYNPPHEPRPTFMPAVLSEGLFLTKPYELYLLKQPRVRQSMAAAYYDAIRAFIAQRPAAVGYEVVSDQGSASAASNVDYRLQLTNRGMDTASGWRLEARYVPPAILYDGSPELGELLGSTSVPSLGRGASAVLDMSLPAPPAGDWLIKFDVVAADGTRLSDLGSPELQLPLTVSTP